MSIYIHDNKVEAREWLYTLYMSLVGYQIPLTRGYWTLCHDQTARNSEIRQLFANGLVRKESQFHGVDGSPGIIRKNEAKIPGANWYNGRWMDVLSHNEKAFSRSSLVYFDLTECPSDRLARDLAFTINMAGPKAVIAVNVMGNNPYKHKQEIFPQDDLPNRLAAFMGDALPEMVGASQYNSSGSTLMTTHVYQKK